jgi:riboflavin kinase/FMN adenylyltransferase
MEVYYDLAQFPQDRPTVLTIGSFDGVHIGHQQILRQLRHLASEIGGRSLLITFHPHPRLVLRQPQGQKLQLLSTLAEKIHWLDHFGLDALAVVPFTAEFAAQSPAEYIERFLVQQFKPRYIVIGYDHRFGKGRVGDIAYLRALEQQYGYEVLEISPQTLEDIAVSSTKIRQALQEGFFAKALQWLGHPYSISGEVVKGQQLGRQLGFPTANLALSQTEKLLPQEGIYAVRVQHQAQYYEGMLYIGARPTLGEDLQPSIEVHLFDFEGDLYGAFLRLDLLGFIRPDEKFEGLEALKAALAADAKAVKAFLGSV